jgi:hypothetical protein
MSLILVIAPLKISINVHARVLSLLLRSSFVISVIKYILGTVFQGDSVLNATLRKRFLDHEQRQTI